MNFETRKIIIDSRIIKHLGSDLITSSDVAVTELVKNSIDAQNKSECKYVNLYLFNSLITLKEKFGKTNFEEQGKSQFYKFIQAKVFTDLEQDRRTFSNRLNKLDYLLEKETNVEVRLKRNPDWKNFQKLQEDFHKTSFFDSLKDLSAGKSK